MLLRSLPWTLRKFAAFRHNGQGAVAIEFAVVAMPFFLILVGILVVGLMMFYASTLDFATQKAARQVMIGSVQSQNLTADQFRTNVLCGFLPSSMFTCANVVVNLTTVVASGEPTAYINFVKPDYSGIIIPPLNNSKTNYCTGSAGGYEVLQVLYPMPLYLSLFASSSRVVNGKYILMSTATFKNEPFQGGPTSLPGC